MLSTLSTLPTSPIPCALPARPGRPGRVIAAAAVGNMLEWYDWTVYGFLITYIGLNFFPTSSAGASLMLTFATFGAGFLMRPVGALAIGWVGEIHGRKTALTLTFLVMAAGTAPIAFIPNYASIGIWAPLLLLLCRLLQGFSTGGELGGSLAFLAEWAPARWRGLHVSLQQASTHAGALLGCGSAALLNALLDERQMADWGWRLPFLFGSLLLPAALWLRLRVDETPHFMAACAQGPSSRRAPTVLAPGLLQAVGLIAAPVACQYLFFTWLAAFAVRLGGLSEAEALGANSAALALLVVLTPLMGAWSDRIGRRPLLALASVALLGATAPALACIAAAPGFTVVLCVQLTLALVVSLFHGAGPAAVTELFATRGRALRVSVAYGIGVALAGGFAPFIGSWLVGRTGSPLAPALYIGAACLVTAWVALRMPETARRELA